MLKATNLKQVDIQELQLACRHWSFIRKNTLRGACDAGRGAVLWLPDGRLFECARGVLLRGTSNNVAEYHGLMACMMRDSTVANLPRDLVFEVDSTLLANQVKVHGPNKHAYRCSTLKPSFLECVKLGWRLRDASFHWRVRHIDHEYNQVADTGQRCN